MTEQEIKDGIKKVCETSTEISKFYNDNDALVEKLNSIPQNELDKLADYYTSRSGVIVDLRKEVLNYLKEGNKLDLATLEGYLLKHKTGKENQYRGYKIIFQSFSQ